VTPFYLSGGILALAQVLGIYALVTRKADLIFSVVMLVMVVVAIAAGVEGAYSQLH